jgi:hypothetical protein
MTEQQPAVNPVRVAMSRVANAWMAISLQRGLFRDRSEVIAVLNDLELLESYIEDSLKEEAKA